MNKPHPSAIHSDEWHKDREEGIGGSEWVSTMSQFDDMKYKYGCARRLYYSKNNVEPNFPHWMNGPMERGNALESVVAAKFIANNPGYRFLTKDEWPNCTVDEDGRVTWLTEEILPGEPRPEWWIGNPDYIYVDDKGVLGILECKTMGESVYFDYIEKSALPDGYILQPLHYMALTGIHEGTLASLWADGMGYQEEAAVFDPSTIEAMLHAGNLFWNEVIKAPKPPARPIPTKERCGRCPFRLRCLKKGYYETKVLHMHEYSNDEALYELLEEYEMAQQACTAHDKVKKVVRHRLRTYIKDKYKDCQHIICRGFEYKNTKGSRKVKDWDRMVTHHPTEAAKVASDVINEIPSTKLLCKRKKGLQTAWELKQMIGE